MNIANLQKALTIISKYVDPNKSWCQGEHDVLYFPLMNDHLISQEDAEELDRLGAHKSDVDCWATYT